MTTSFLRSVRFAFVTLLLGLTAYTAIESALGGHRVVAQDDEGLSTCGTAAQPCALETVAVVAEAADPVQLAANEGLSACGTAEEPCLLAPVSVNVPARETARMVSNTDRVPPVTVRAKS
ncbi:MAG TPA: hypothetical protein VHG93_15360 [Longimicrobium sp.]|nr:hypothetical protein [Longimicrobium sp.]